MDNNVKTYVSCYQVLFNKPLCMSEDKLIYGFRIKEDELKHKPLSEKQLLRYIVEGIFGKCLFESLHGGSFKGHLHKIWVDREGYEYKEGSVQTRLYSYDATVVEKMNYRYDLVYVEEGEDYWITDPLQYFKLRSMMDEDDHKQGKNQWMENYLRIQSRRDVLSNIIVKSSENLDYNTQELIKEEWLEVNRYENMDVLKKNREEGDSVEDEGYSDDLPF